MPQIAQQDKVSELMLEISKKTLYNIGNIYFFL